MMLATLFVHPLQVPSQSILPLLIPLCLSVALVYRALRLDDLRELPKSVAILMLTMLGGLMVLGLGLWIFQIVFL